MGDSYGPIVVAQQDGATEVKGRDDRASPAR